MNKILTIMTSAATIAMAAIPLSAVPAFAHAEGVKVEVADLNLSQPADAIRFKARVDRAAEHFCDNSDRSLSQGAACREAIFAEAVEKLGDAQRRDLHIALQSTGHVGWRVASF